MFYDYSCSFPPLISCIYAVSGSVLRSEEGQLVLRFDKHVQENPLLPVRGPDVNGTDLRLFDSYSVLILAYT